MSSTSNSSAAHVSAAAALLVLCAAMVVGCTETQQEASLQDIEKSRQQHIEMMQRETGQAATDNQ